MGLVRRGMKSEGNSRQVFDPDGLGRVLSVSATRWRFLTTRSAGGRRDHQGGLQQETRGGQPGADLRGSPVDGSDTVGAIRKGAAGRVVWRERG